MHMSSAVGQHQIWTCAATRACLAENESEWENKINPNQRLGVCSGYIMCHFDIYVIRKEFGWFQL